MRIAVSGSIAEDFLLTFPGRFADMILPDQLDRLSLSFLADDLTHHRGGVGANIAYGMGQLGADPLLIGAVGTDFDGGYRRWLLDHDVDCSGVHISDKATARFLCTTDIAQSQIATFYAGAMGDSHLIGLPEVIETAGPIDLVIISPAGPEGMSRHTREAHDLGIPVVADPSQQLARLDGPAIAELVEGAQYLICNDYERGLILSKTGWDADKLHRTVGVMVTTYGAEGAVVAAPDTAPIEIPAVLPDPERTLEPTGAGDAFRAGFLSGLHARLALAHCTMLGCAVATAALEASGPQGYRLTGDWLRSRLAGTYGADEAATILDALALS